jgi:uncharacterized protein involved in exopolysaccharide biosynthesis
MAERKQDLIGLLANRGEDVVGKLSEMPTAQRIVEAANGLRERADELQKRLRGLDALEARVTALEKKVDHLSGAKRAAPKRAATKRTTAKKTTPKPS